MSEHTVIRDEIAECFREKYYRDNFVESHLATNLATQIYLTREKRGWTQSELAKRAEMKQSRISTLEDGDHANHSLSTLKRIAAALDVALIVRLAPYEDVVSWAVEATEANLAIDEFKGLMFADSAPMIPILVVNTQFKSDVCAGVANRHNAWASKNLTAASTYTVTETPVKSMSFATIDKIDGDSISVTV